MPGPDPVAGAEQVAGRLEDDLVARQADLLGLVPVAAHVVGHHRRKQAFDRRQQGNREFAEDIAFVGRLEDARRLLQEAHAGFEEIGYLFLLDDVIHLQQFRAALALQESLGVDSRELTVDQARELVPQIETHELVGATYSPRDGRAMPEAVVQGYAAAAAERGVRIRQGVAVQKIPTLGNKILGVETSAGRVRTDTVVCTAGIWSRELAHLVGVELPVTGEPRWMHYAADAGDLAERVPLTIDFTSGFYFHRDGPGLVFGGREPTIEGVATHATRRLPLLTDLPIQSSWWGYYEMSPDRNGIVGEAHEPRRFLYATGFSGHGFQQCPAVGEHIAELIAGREPTIDLSPISAARFADGKPRPERFVV